MGFHMHTTRRAEKVWEPSETTQRPIASAPSIIANATRYRALSKAGQSGTYVATRMPSPSATEGSIWGWAAMHRWTSENGYFSAEDDGTAPWSPPHPDDE